MATAKAIRSPVPALSPSPAELDITKARLVVLASGLPGPDDLLIGPDRSIYLSDVNDGTIKRFTPAGNQEVFLTGLNEPEGMVFLPDGSLLIVEQGANRIVLYNPNTKSVSLFLKLENKSGKLGVDGIALAKNANGPSGILIPDSPNGRILRASLDGKTIRLISGGFVRPTGIWQETDGNLLVVDEIGGTLSRLHPDGKIELIARLPTPDDVIEDEAGNIFVNTLGDGAIHLIRAGTIRDEILVGGLSSPQGLALDADGNLIVADPGNHRLVKIVLQ